VAPKVLVVDDHALIRAGVRSLLQREKEYEIVDEVATGDEAIRAALAHKPDIVLLDVSVPGPGGIEVTRRIREKLPETRVVILTVHEDAALVREAVSAGASGYVIKRALDSELLSALETVRRGDVYVHPSLTRALLEDQQSAPKRKWGDPSTLTDRETEVVKLLTRGHTNRQIADELDLSVRTVESHRAHIMAKLGLSSRAELVRWAAKHKLTT
jgi:two-component system, NarL family, response regulator NreC